MPQLLDLMSPQNVIDYVANREYDVQAGEALFPEKKQQSLEIEYLQGANAAPVSASIHAFNTESEIASRDGGKLVKEKIALVKRKIGIDEKLIVRLNNLREDSPMFNSIIDTIYNDVDNMVRSVRVRVERMRYEALSTGKITANENGAKFEVDYGFGENQLQTSDWTNPDVDILADIDKWIDSVVDSSGVTPTRILTSRKIARLIGLNTKVRKDVLGDSSKRLGLADLNNWLISQGLPVIGTEDRVYREQLTNGQYVNRRYLDENTFVLLPDGPLGETIYGPTPEEIRLMSNPAIDTSFVGNILAMVYEENVDPVASYTKAVATVLPSFPTAGQILSATVVPSDERGLPGA